VFSFNSRSSESDPVTGTRSGASDRYNGAFIRRLGVYRLSGTVRYVAAHAVR